MSTLALTFALSAAVFHALWNLLLARAPDVESATVVALVTSEVVFAPLAVLVWRVDGGAWPWLAASGCFELAYFTLLAAAYRSAPLSVVYPVARGGAPVVVLLASWAVSARQVAAVALIVAGVLLVRGLRHPDRRGLAFGVAIACCIGGYTLVDKHGIAHAGPIPYLELSMVGPTLFYGAAITRVRGARAVRAALRPPMLVAGIATFVAYAFVLAALERAPAASVAAVRETSVVIAAALAAVVLKERVSRWRFLGACVVVAGIAVLA
jgi:drug/metabolite transporter (DMT)-like permease